MNQLTKPRIIESLYTDGACLGNPGVGGWGIVTYFADGSVYEMGGAVPDTTNNRMELQAAIEALQIFRACEQTEPITLYTDSEYVIKGITQWIKGWKRKNWKTSQGKPVLNQDLWKALDQLNDANIRWQHVRGHSGNVGNERCDAIAFSFASGRSPSLEQTYSPLAEVDPLRDLSVAQLSDSNPDSKVAYSHSKQSVVTSDMAMIESSTLTGDDLQLPREVRVSQLNNLIDTLRIADEIASKGYLISSSELADLMDVNASAVTSRGDNWPWRNWVVSRVRREGNQILWQLERVD
jgi:ribonuclease HI